MQTTQDWQGRPYPFGSTAAATRRPRIAVIPRDGIGVEVTAQALRALPALGSRPTWSTFPWSAEHYQRRARRCPKARCKSWPGFDAILFGALGDPRIPEQIVARDVLLGLRFGLDLYINLRPVELFDERLCPLKGKTRKAHRLCRAAREHRGTVRADGRVV